MVSVISLYARRVACASPMAGMLEVHLQQRAYVKSECVVLVPVSVAVPFPVSVPVTVTPRETGREEERERGRDWREIGKEEKGGRDAGMDTWGEKDG